ncbi:MAG: PDZ domain-containing protein [Planctomycetes bacterium]|nr:PDZ domain-containing protein [Planctomycetota bacterium]
MTSTILKLSLAAFLVVSTGGLCAQEVSSAGGAEYMDFRDVVQDAKDKVFPSVVFINCLRETLSSGRKVTGKVSGSGVLISPDGELLTNWHVVDKAVEVRCLLSDGRGLNARIIGTDKDTDLALLKLELPNKAEPLPYAKLGDSSLLKEGDFVMAMGAPWGLNRSVSIGIISCTKRFLPENSEYSLWLQTDASISPGNSGGPLINTNGEIVGINTRGVMYGGDVGFAIPSLTVSQIVDQIRKFGKVNWSWLGLQLQPIKDFDRNMYFDGDQGVIVGSTDPDSPARNAGIKPRDRILKVGGMPITGLTEESLPIIRNHLGMLPMHQEVEIEFQRGQEVMKVMVTPREKGRVEGEELDCPRWDMTVKTINQFDNPDLYFHRNTGVFIYGVNQPGNASNAGLRPNDIILTIDSQEVNSLEDLKDMHKKALDNIESQHKMVMTVLRNGLLRQIVLDFSRDYEKR